MADSWFEEICGGNFMDSAGEEFSCFTDVEKMEHAQKKKTAGHKSTRLKHLFILRIFLLNRAKNQLNQNKAQSVPLPIARGLSHISQNSSTEE